MIKLSFVEPEIQRKYDDVIARSFQIMEQRSGGLTLSDFCYYCERPFSAKKSINKTRDHVIPLSMGGNNSSENIIMCCSFCNSLKGRHLPGTVVEHLLAYKRVGTCNKGILTQIKKYPPEYINVLIDNFSAAHRRIGHRMTFMIKPGAVIKSPTTEEEPPPVRKIEKLKKEETVRLFRLTTETHDDLVAARVAQRAYNFHEDYVQYGYVYYS